MHIFAGMERPISKPIHSSVNLRLIFPSLSLLHFWIAVWIACSCRSHYLASVVDVQASNRSDLPGNICNPDVLRLCMPCLRERAPFQVAQGGAAGDSRVLAVLGFLSQAYHQHIHASRQPSLMKQHSTYNSICLDQSVVKYNAPERGLSPLRRGGWSRSENETRHRE